MLPVRPNGPYYVFLLLSRPAFAPDEREFRSVRGKLLEAFCMVVRARYPDAKDIVGLATDAGNTAARSEEVLYLDGRAWSNEQQAEAESLQRDLQLLTNLSGPVHYNEKEYPEYPRALAKPKLDRPKRARSIRNSLCPCGSGKKVKRCCGR
jgi:hypothetical protein